MPIYTLHGGGSKHLALCPLYTVGGDLGPVYVQMEPWGLLKTWEEEALPPIPKF